MMPAPCTFAVPKLKSEGYLKKKKEFAIFFLVILGSFVSKSITEQSGDKQKVLSFGILLPALKVLLCL